MRKICYITGTRADFGLMTNALQAIEQDSDLELEIIVTGMHLLPKYGNTHKEISDSGFKIVGNVEVDLSGASGSQMSIALGDQIIGITKVLEANEPDVILLLGDRGEMLAGAIVGIHLNIPVVHIHGGERSGTIDEPIRHAISKLSHYHFVTTKQSRDRLVKMGEIPDNIFITGAPGLDEVINSTFVDRKTVMDKYNLDHAKDFVMVLFHPVVQELLESGTQVKIILDALLKFEIQILILMPNSDAGSDSISDVINQYSDRKNVEIIKHAPRLDYLSLIRESLVLVGNSSSGIIEAASFGTYVLNIGNRQKYRERNDNTVDVNFNSKEIEEEFAKLLNLKEQKFINKYGDGKASERITSLLKSILINATLMEKTNAY